MDNASSETATTRTFFDSFSGAFATFDGHAVADLFATPGVALGRDGSIVPLTSRDDVVRYYQSALDRYRRDGCRAARWSQLATTPMGRRSLLATVTWDLLREDGSSAAQWRQSYGLIMSDDDKPKIFASATHAE
jgi:hypothetical protein